MNNIDTVKGILQHMITPENPTHVQDIANELADAGLLMPDLPAPDLSADDPKHQAKHRALWGGEVPNVWNKGLPSELTLQTFPDDPDVAMYRDLEPEEPFSPSEARQLAYALLSAADYAEEQQ